MSLYVYFSNDVEKVGGFQKVEKTDRGKKYSDYSLPGFSNLWFSEGRYHVSLQRLTDRIPDYLLGCVEEISYKDTIPDRPKRETGIYRLRDAEAEVEKDLVNNKGYYVRIRAKKMEDALELFRLIQIGNIRPDESFECEQAGLSGSEITAEFFRVLDEVNLLRMCDENAGPFIEESVLKIKQKELRISEALDYIHKVRKERWPSRTPRKEIFETLWTLLCPAT